MLAKILLADDGESILMGYRRNLRKRFDLDLATTGDADQRTAADAVNHGQVFRSQVVTEDGMIVLLPGIRLSVGHLQLLRNLAEPLNLREPILIHPERT